MDALPNRGREIVQPEIVAGDGHEEEDREREESEDLKRKIGEAEEARVADEEADQRVQVAQRVELKNRKCAVPQGEHEHGDAEVAAVVEQRQKSAVEPAQGADAEDDVQQEKRGGAESADQQGFGGGVGVDQRPDSHEEREVQRQSAGEDAVVNLLGAVPTHRQIADTHWYCSQLRPLLGGVVVRRARIPAKNTRYSTAASTSQIRKCARRRGRIISAHS